MSVPNYENLEIMISCHNVDYNDHNWYEAQAKTKEEKLKAQHQKWQFIHDYATNVSDYIIQNIDKLDKEDLLPLDLIPYTVWIRMTAKSRIIIEKIKKQQEKELL